MLNSLYYELPAFADQSGRFTNTQQTFIGFEKSS